MYKFEKNKNKIPNVFNIPRGVNTCPALNPKLSVGVKTPSPPNIHSVGGGKPIQLGAGECLWADQNSHP